MNDPLDDPVSDYLSGLMDERETAEFERRMESDPALRLEVETGRETLKRLAVYLEQTCPGLERADALDAAALFTTVRQEDETDSAPVREDGEILFQEAPPLPEIQVVPVAPSHRSRFGRFLAQGFAAAAIFAAGILVGTRMPATGETAPTVSLEDTAPREKTLPEATPPPVRTETSSSHGGKTGERSPGTASAPAQIPVPAPAPTPPPPDGERSLPVAEPVRVAQSAEETVQASALQSPPIRVTRREGARTIVESAPSRAIPPALWVVDGSFRLVQNGAGKTLETQPEARERK